MTVAGSKITRSAASPSLISPRSVMCSCFAVRPLILWTACSSGITFSSRTYLPSTRGNVPKLRGCGTPMRSGPLVASAEPSDPIDTHGCFIASFRSFSSMMNQTQLTLPRLAMRMSKTKSYGSFPGGLRRFVDAHPFVFLVRRLSNRRQLNVVPGAGGDEAVLPRRVRVVHLLANLRARLRISEPLGELGAAAFVRPRRHGL